ncbi:hypothetical protein GGQ72_000171 [Rhizobium rhizoryzae]|jgi:hypothetical protein|uniref:Uncharacterized protein n=1 Tax=Rhizobium rhizoryzae TaxID=451876 RepID=A0A7W6PQ91_9HYPH|nr:hypothetical protein [Rhizobium rhizoryzae]
MNYHLLMCRFGAARPALALGGHIVYSAGVRVDTLGGNADEARRMMPFKSGGDWFPVRILQITSKRICHEQRYL